MVVNLLQTLGLFLTGVALGWAMPLGATFCHSDMPTWVSPLELLSITEDGVEVEDTSVLIPPDATHRVIFIPSYPSPQLEVNPGRTNELIVDLSQKEAP